MKKVLEVFFLCFSLLIMTTSVYAAEHHHMMDEQAINHVLKSISGDWYDTYGNLVLTIQNGYINGCSVVAGHDFAGGNPGGGYLVIDEASGHRDIKFDWDTIGRVTDHHYLIMNKKTLLRRTKECSYYESIGGIYCGMTAKQLVQKYGQPSRIKNSFWYYDDQKFSVVMIEGEMVNSIRIYPGCNLHFDRSGLGIKDSYSVYSQAYGFEYVKGREANPIGHEEYIWFEHNPESVCLSMFSW